MRVEVANDLSVSANAFLNTIWPLLKPIMGGEIVPVESVTERSFAKDKLDILAGIDAWQIFDGVGIRGIASRVQWVERAWPTFTIRYRRTSGATTEYEKRRRAIESPHGLIYPALTIQAYLKTPKGSDDILGIAVAYTKDIIALIRDGQKGKDWQLKTNGADGNEFAVVKWETLRRKGLPCHSCLDFAAA